MNTETHNHWLLKTMKCKAHTSRQRYKQLQNVGFS